MSFPINGHLLYAVHIQSMPPDGRLCLFFQRRHHNFRVVEKSGQPVYPSKAPGDDHIVAAAPVHPFGVLREQQAIRANKSADSGETDNTLSTNFIRIGGKLPVL